MASESFVRRIIFEPETTATSGLRATGAELELNTGEVLNVYSDREVICSAGAIGTPQILMLSGIGPKSHLEAVGVKCLADHPAVGQNLQEPNPNCEQLSLALSSLTLLGWH